MDPSSIVFASFLLVVSVVLSIIQIRTWKADSTADDERSLDFARRKYRRRMQANVMIGITGAAILIGLLLPARPMLTLIYWAAVGAWAIWIALLAIADMLDTRRHVADLQR